jgi:hypothetical protein
MGRSVLIVQMIVLFCLVIHGCSNSDGSRTGAGEKVNLAGGRMGAIVDLLDVDGDGFDDLVVGAPYAVSQSFIGTLLVYKGGISGFNSEPDHLFSADDNFGCSLVNLGDVGEDGHDEFAVGAMHGHGEDVSLAGSVTIFKGGSGGQVLRKLSGENPMDKFGYTLAAGSFSGSGKKDLVVGAPFATVDPAVYQGGSVYVYLAPDFETSIAIHSTREIKGLGWSMTAGDINGDGVEDLLIGASGRVLVFFGGEGFHPSSAAPDVIITSSSGGFGRALAVVDDLNGDGYGEIAIGAPLAATASGIDTGSLYLIRGGPGRRLIDADAAEADLLVRINGETAFSRFGSFILPLNDLDRGGKPDLAVSSPMADAGGNLLSGKVHLLLGESLTVQATLADAITHDGLLASQGFGTSMARSRDGAMLIIGAPRTDADKGKIYLVDPLGGTAGMEGDSAVHDFDDHCW